MSNSTSRKLSIGLAITGFVLVASMFILFLAKHAVSIDFGGVGSTYFASLITLGFGGSWESTYGQTPTYSGNALLAIAFIFVIIALIIAAVILYGHISKKFLPKTTLILCLVVVGLILFATTVICCTKAIAVNILIKDSAEMMRELLNKYTKITGNVIALSVLGFISLACFTGIGLIPYIKKTSK